MEGVMRRRGPPPVLSFLLQSSTTVPSKIRCACHQVHFHSPALTNVCFFNNNCKLLQNPLAVTVFFFYKELISFFSLNVVLQLCLPLFSSSVRQWEKCLPDSWCRLAVCLETRQLLFWSTTTLLTGNSHLIVCTDVSFSHQIFLHIIPFFLPGRVYRSLLWCNRRWCTPDFMHQFTHTHTHTVLDNPMKWEHTVKCRLG